MQSIEQQLDALNLGDEVCNLHYDVMQFEEEQRKFFNRIHERLSNIRACIDQLDAPTLRYSKDQLKSMEILLD